MKKILFIFFFLICGCGFIDLGGDFDIKHWEHKSSALFIVSVLSSIGFKSDLFVNGDDVIINTSNIHKYESTSTGAKITYIINRYSDVDLYTYINVSNSSSEIAEEIDKGANSNMLTLTDLDGVSFYVNISNISACIEYSSYTDVLLSGSSKVIYKKVSEDIENIMTLAGRLTEVVVVLGDKTDGFNRTLSDLVDGVLLEQDFDYIVGVGDYSLEDQNPNTLPYSSSMDNYTNYDIYPTVGNHDITGDLGSVDGDAENFKDFFGLSNTYYKKTIGYADFFFFDVNLKADESGYNTILETFTRSKASFENSTQGQWLLTQLEASTNIWKIVVYHQSTYSSATTGYKVPGMNWDWADLGVNLIINGHFHWYERCLVTYDSGSVTHVTCGASGAGGISARPPIAESIIQITAANPSAIRGSVLVLQITGGTIIGNLHGVGLIGQDNAGLDTFTITL